MEVRIVKNFEDMEYCQIAEGVTLQKSRGNLTTGNLTSKKYELLYLNDNRKEEIIPKISKYDIWEIINLSCKEEYIYFCECIVKERVRIQINLTRYALETKECEILYTVEDDCMLYPAQKKTKVFILDENYILFQNMYLKSNTPENYQGFMDFELFLYSMKEKKVLPVTDQYLLQAGIDQMLPFSKNICAIKTGYDLLTDNRFECLDDKECVQENVGFVNLRQMISDILLKQKNVFIDIIDQVRTKKTIPAMQVMDQYLVYSRVSKEGQEEVIFYNYDSKEALAGIRENVFSLKQLSKSCLLNQVPCILSETRKGTEIYNLQKAKAELILGKDIRIKKTIGNLIITEVTKKKTLFSKASSSIEVHQYPEKKLLIKEKGHYADAYSPRPDMLYVFVI